MVGLAGGPGVCGGHHEGERRQTATDKPAVDTVYEVGMGASEGRRVAAPVARYVFGPRERLGAVVEEEGEAPDAAAAGELCELPRDGAAIVSTRVAHVEPGAQRVDEANLCLPRHTGGGAQVGEAFGGIGLAPAVAMERVVLRAVDEGVHAAGAEEADDVASRLAGPGTPVVPLDDAAQWDRPCHRRTRQ